MALPGRATVSYGACGELRPEASATAGIDTDTGAGERLGEFQSVFLQAYQ